MTKTPAHTQHYPARHAKKPKKIWTALKILATTLIILLLSTTTISFYLYHQLKNSIETITINLPTPTKTQYEETPPQAAKTTLNGAYNLLIIGSDSRQGQQYQDGVDSQLNDVTILLKIDENHTRIDIISFPRDLVIDYECTHPETNINSGAGPKMLNEALTHGETPCVAQTITQITNEPIHGATLVNFDSVIELTTAINGIPLCFTRNIYDLNDPQQKLLFHEGENNLQGMDALNFLRERKSMGDGGDLNRIENQKLFLQSSLNKIKQEKILQNPVKLYQLAEITVNNLKMTEELTKTPMLLSFAETINTIPFENIQFHTAPNITHPNDPNRLILNEQELNTLLQEINTPKIVETEQTLKTIQGTVGTLNTPQNQEETQQPEPQKETQPAQANNTVHLCN